MFTFVIIKKGSFLLNAPISHYPTHFPLCHSFPVIHNIHSYILLIQYMEIGCGVDPYRYTMHRIDTILYYRVPSAEF